MSKESIDGPFDDCELGPEAILGTRTYEDVLFTDETETLINVLTGETPEHSKATVDEAQASVDHIGLEEASAWRGCATWRHPAAGGAASGGGRPRSSVRWCCGPLGQRPVCAELFQRTSHSTTGSSGSCPPVRTAVVSGDAVASAAVRHRQRPLSLRLTVRPTSRQSKHRPNRFSAY